MGLGLPEEDKSRGGKARNVKGNGRAFVDIFADVLPCLAFIPSSVLKESNDPGPLRPKRREAIFSKCQRGGLKSREIQGLTMW